jgi:hypothetical protein
VGVPSIVENVHGVEMTMEIWWVVCGTWIVIMDNRVNVVMKMNKVLRVRIYMEYNLELK